MDRKRRGMPNSQNMKRLTLLSLQLLSLGFGSEERLHLSKDESVYDKPQRIRKRYVLFDTGESISDNQSKSHPQENRDLKSAKHNQPGSRQQGIEFGEYRDLKRNTEKNQKKSGSKRDKALSELNSKISDIDTDVLESVLRNTAFSYAETSIPVKSPTSRPSMSGPKSSSPTRDAPTPYGAPTQKPTQNVEIIDPDDEGCPPSPTPCPVNLSQSETIREDLVLYYDLILDKDNDPNNGILCIRLEYDGEGWLGFGFSPNGKMVGSDAVIGLPDEAGGVTNPGKYSLDGQTGSLVSLMPDEQQTLLDGSIRQENGMTVLEFGKMLLEPDQVDIVVPGENTFIYAAASSNQFGYHGIRRGSFTLYFEDTTIP